MLKAHRFRPEKIRKTSSQKYTLLWISLILTSFFKGVNKEITLNKNFIIQIKGF